MIGRAVIAALGCIACAGSCAQDEWITYFMVRFDPAVRSRITDVDELAGRDSILYTPIDSSRMRALGVELGIKGGNHMVGYSIFTTTESLVGNAGFRASYAYLPQGSAVSLNDTMVATIKMLHQRLFYAYGTNTRRTNAFFNAFVGLDHVVGRLLIVDSTFVAYVNAMNGGQRQGAGYNDLNQYRSDLFGITIGGNLGFAMLKTEDFQLFFTVTPSFSVNHRMDTLLDGSKHHRGLRSSVGLSLGIGFGGTWKRYRSY